MLPAPDAGMRGHSLRPWRTWLETVGRSVCCVAVPRGIVCDCRVPRVAAGCSTWLRGGAHPPARSLHGTPRPCSPMPGAPKQGRHVAAGCYVGSRHEERASLCGCPRAVLTSWRVLPARRVVAAGCHIGSGHGEACPALCVTGSGHCPCFPWHFRVAPCGCAPHPPRSSQVLLVGGRMGGRGTRL